MPSPSISSELGNSLVPANLHSVSVARGPSSEASSAALRTLLRPISSGYLEVFLDPVWTPLPPPVSLQALSSPDDICAYSLPLGACELPYALSKKFMSQVNCLKHSVKKLQFMPHDLSAEDDDACNGTNAVGAASVGCQSSKASSYVWELCYLRGTWVPYPQDTCLLLEDALMSRKHGLDKLVQIKARDVGLHAPVNRHATSSRAVVVDVSAMCQVNVFTGMQHQVRRRRPSAEPPSGVGICPPPPAVPYTLHPALASRIPVSIFTKPHSALRIGCDPTSPSASATHQLALQPQHLKSSDHPGAQPQRGRKLKHAAADRSGANAQTQILGLKKRSRTGAESSSSVGAAQQSSSSSSSSFAESRKQIKSKAAASGGQGAKTLMV